MLNPTVSIIIPCYNAEKTLERTLLSTLQQTYSQIEVIVVNDGSTDNSHIILDKYSSQIHIIIQENQGVQSARQQGLKYASGEWICFLDSDDILLPETLERQLALVRRNADVDVAYCYAQQVFEETQKVYKTLNKPMQDCPKLALIRDFWLPISAYFFRKNVFDNLTIRHNFPIFNDSYLVWSVAHRQAKFMENPFLGTIYYIQESSLSRQGGLVDYFKDRMRYLELVEEHLKPNANSETAQILTEAYRDGNRVFVRYAPQLFQKCTKKIYKLSPNYIPKKSWKMHWLSRFFGYKKAEKIASWFRF